MKETIQKIVHISHDDWDGEGALHLSALAYEGKYPLSLRALSLHQNAEGWTQVEIHLHDFVLNHWTKETHLVVTDVSFRDEIAQLIQQKVEEGYSFALIDHHKTAEWLGEKYEWATVISEINGEKTCATSLYLTHLWEQEQFYQYRQLAHYVELVRQYDTWAWTVTGEEGISSKRINDLLFIIGRKEFAQIILQELRDESKFHKKFELPEKVTYLLDVEQYRIEQYIERKAKQLRKFPQTINDREYLVGGVFLENYHSEAGNALCNLNTDIDFVVMVDAGKEKLSFRTIKEDVDVSAIAKTFKGGGHPKASGCSFNKETKELFVMPLF